MSSEMAKGQAAEGNRKNTTKKGTGGWTFYRINNQSLGNSAGSSNKGFATQNAWQSLIMDRPFLFKWKKKCWVHWATCPKVHSSSKPSLPMSRKETVGLIKPHWIEILPKIVKCLCQIWMSLESRTPWLKKHLKNRFHSLKENKNVLLTYGVVFTYLTLLKKYIWHICVIYTWQEGFQCFRNIYCHP